MWCTVFVWLHSCNISFILFHSAVVLHHSVVLHCMDILQLILSTIDGQCGSFCLKLWWIKLLWTVLYMPFGGYKHPHPWIYTYQWNSGSEFCIYLSLDKTANNFQRGRTIFPFPTAMKKGLSSTFLPTFDILVFLILVIYNCVCVCMHMCMYAWNRYF